MSLYAVALCIHVVTAILGLGQLAGLAVVARSEGANLDTLNTLARYVSISLGIMLLSGALTEFAAGGAFHDTWWFRGSFVGLVVLGALGGRIRRTLKKREAGAARVVGQTALIMCAITAVIAVLMEVKP